MWGTRSRAYSGQSVPALARQITLENCKPPILVGPAAADGTPTTHKVSITLNFEPNARVRLYQFDPAHHDVAVYTLH